MMRALTVPLMQRSVGAAQPAGKLCGRHPPAGGTPCWPLSGCTCCGSQGARSCGSAWTWPVPSSAARPSLRCARATACPFSFRSLGALPLLPPLAPCCCGCDCFNILLACLPAACLPASAMRHSRGRCPLTSFMGATRPVVQAGCSFSALTALFRPSPLPSRSGRTPRCCCASWQL